jgi:hypothetical protein
VCRTVKKGTTGRFLFVSLRDEAGAPITGLTATTSGATAAYVREGEAVAHQIDLVSGALGLHEAGGFVEVDDVLAPGLYQLAVPDAALAAGADTVALLVTFPGARSEPVEVSLVAYDPQDEERLGMAAIGREGRIAALRGAFPLLAEQQLREAERSGSG